AADAYLSADPGAKAGPKNSLVSMALATDQGVGKPEQCPGMVLTDQPCPRRSSQGHTLREVLCVF
ncbi:MAG: hypothetical protein ACKO4L_10710, partial [Nodosilinea sp.]